MVDEEEGPIQAGNGGEALNLNALLPLILALLGSTERPTGEVGGGASQDLLKLLLPLLLQATPAGQQIQLVELLVRLLTGKPVGSPTPLPSPMPTDIGSQLLPLLLQLLGGRR